MGKRGNNEGSIYKLPNGKWRASLTVGRVNGKVQRKYFYAATRREVVAKLEVAKREIGAGVPAASRLTVREYLATWLEAVEKTRRPLTAKGYASHVDIHINPAIGDIQLAKLDPRAVQRFVDGLSSSRHDDLTANTVHRIHATLRVALNQAVKWRYIQVNPAVGVSLPAVEKFVPRIPSVDEIKQFLLSVRGDRLEALYYLLLGTGLRQGEALGMRWKAIDFDERTVTVYHALQRIDGELQLVTPKTASSRATLYLPEIVIDPLLRLKAMQADERRIAGPPEPILVDGQPQDVDLVFTTAAGKPYDGTSVTHRFQKQLAAAGLPKQRIYDYRHACATILLEEGADLREIMGQLRHTTIQLAANTYTHMRPATSRKNASRIDSALGVLGSLADQDEQPDADPIPPALLQS